jgi:hypothetical protein
MAKNPAAVALGRLGGKVGGKARMEAMTPAERSEFARQAGKAGGKARMLKLSARRRREIARQGAEARWKKQRARAADEGRG